MDWLKQLLLDAKSIGKYHQEHAGYGGTSQEFHMIAQTFCESSVPACVSELQKAQELEGEITRRVELLSDMCRTEKARAEAAEKKCDELAAHLAVLNKG